MEWTIKLNDLNNNNNNTESAILEYGCKDDSDYFGPGLRKKILKHLHGRYVLILVCTLVVVECMCIMAELMVDLQGIRIRFENEEKGVQEFIKFMKLKHPDTFGEFEGKRLEEILTLMKESTSLWDSNERTSECDCKCDDVITNTTNQESVRRRRDLNGIKQQKRVHFRKATNQNVRNIESTSPSISDTKSQTPGSDTSVSVSLTSTDVALKSAQFKHNNKPDSRGNTTNKLTAALSYVSINKSEHNSEKTSRSNLWVHIDDEKPVIKEELIIDSFHSVATSQSNSNHKRDRKAKRKNISDRLEHSERTQFAYPKFSRKNEKLEYKCRRYLLTHNSLPSKKLRRHKRDSHDDDSDNVAKVFVFVVNTEVQNFYLAARFVDMDDKIITSSDVRADEVYASFHKQYDRIHSISYVIKYTGFSILSLMVAETLLKFACMGFGFFRKKFEVFDAFIVLVSFALDVIFQDNSWYETGKDATTILVLLLPWRVVRIVNSFLMTINHKHYIEVMTIRRAKKRGEIKLKKVQNLVVEMRRDIDLLINLGKVKGATDAEIAACISLLNKDTRYMECLLGMANDCENVYNGKGRGTTTLAAITSFASLMFISTLGKDPCSDDAYDDVYGDIIRDILADDDDGDENSEKTTTDTATEKDEFDLESMCRGETYTRRNPSVKGTSKTTSNNNTVSKPPGKEWPLGARRATIPRRQASCGDDDADRSVYYVNDGYVTGDDVKTPNSSMYSKSSVRSMPTIGGAPSKNFMAFEVTTQVTYL